MRAYIAGIAAILVAASAPAWAQPDIREEQVQFQHGKNSASLKGSIKGYAIVDYRLRAAAGQALEVALRSTNRANYFNVLPTNEETALFVGSTSGNRYSGKLPRDGDYTVRVYLMRSAARRGEKADFTLDIRVTGNPPAGAATVSVTSVDLGPMKYDATGTVRCSAAKPTLDAQCGFRVVRDKAKGSAEIWIANAAVKGKAAYRALHYADKVFTTTDKADLSWQRQDDNWWLGVDGKEFYLIPDALIHGG